MVKNTQSRFGSRHYETSPLLLQKSINKNSLRPLNVLMSWFWTITAAHWFTFSPTKLEDLSYGNWVVEMVEDMVQYTPKWLSLLKYSNFLGHKNSTNFHNMVKNSFSKSVLFLLSPSLALFVVAVWYIFLVGKETVASSRDVQFSIILSLSLSSSSSHLCFICGSWLPRSLICISGPSSAPVDKCHCEVGLRFLNFSECWGRAHPKGLLAYQSFFIFLLSMFLGLAFALFLLSLLFVLKAFVAFTPVDCIWPFLVNCSFFSINTREIRFVSTFSPKYITFM